MLQTTGNAQAPVQANITTVINASPSMIQTPTQEEHSTTTPQSGIYPSLSEVETNQSLPETQTSPLKKSLWNSVRLPGSMRKAKKEEKLDTLTNPPTYKEATTPATESVPTSATWRSYADIMAELEAGN